MELGIYSFGDIATDPHTGKKPTTIERTRQLMEMAKLADDAGLEVIGIGEHHGLDFVNSATATLISGMAAATKRIRFTSASTLLSTADPVRTFQEFSMADLVSGGRVEIIFGRGAFNDNFPLFSYDMKDYDALFDEKLRLFELLNSNERVTWSGKFRPQLREAEIAPRPHQPKLPVSIGALSQSSVERVAKLGYPLMIPVLGGSMEGYADIAAHHRYVWGLSGRKQDDAKISLFSHFQVTETAEETQQEFYPYYSKYMWRMFRGPIPAATYAHMLSPAGTFVGGSVQQVVDKISMLKEATGAHRYVGQIDVGAPPFSTVAKGIELMATRVAEQLR